MTGTSPDPTCPQNLSPAPPLKRGGTGGPGTGPEQCDHIWIKDGVEYGTGMALAWCADCHAQFRSADRGETWELIDEPSQKSGTVTDS